MILFTATILKLSHEGRGIARNTEGKTQFIDNALPNEQVRAKRVKSHAKYDEAIAIEILHSNPKRISPPCDYYLTCGGCRLQHLDSESQIDFKAELLQEQLTHIAKIAPREIVPPIQSKTFEYRRKARLTVKYIFSQKKAIIGFHQLNGHQITDLTRCLVLNKKLSDLIAPLTQCINQLSIPQFIQQVELALGDNQPAVILRHTAAFNFIDIEKRIEFSKKHRIYLYLQSAGNKSIKKLWPQDDEIEIYYLLPRYQLTLWFHPSDFIQVNDEINQLMIDQAIQLLNINKNDHVLDLLCGIGNFSLPMARFAKKVLGIEGDAKMITDAKNNAKFNHIENVEFSVSDLNLPLKNIRDFFPTKILMDPPRTGAFAVLPYVIALKPERLVYVSCNPATFARDAQYLTNNGYQLDKTGVMDMFPHTQHVEAIALFTKKLQA